MANRVDNYLGVGRFVKNDVWVRRRVQAANNRIGCADPDVRMGREKIDYRLDACMNPLERAAM
jgi:hypothetical protein